MLSRRNLLAGIFAAASAPAIVRASSIMKIGVPPELQILYPMEIGRIDGFRFITSEYIPNQDFSDIRYRKEIEKLRLKEDKIWLDLARASFLKRSPAPDYGNIKIW